MAGKFRIFCDERPRPTFEPEDKPSTATVTTNQHQRVALSATTTTDTATSNSIPPLNNQSDLTAKFIASIQPHAAGGGGGGPLQPIKREPLGLRQTVSQAMAASTAPVVVEAPPSSSSTSYSGCMGPDEDQENDISMASLGSDFVPSILEDEDDYDERSFEVEDYGALVADSDDEELDNLDDDEEIRMELSQAFKQHDDSQLFKGGVYINDIQDYLQELERNPELRPLPNYMDYQSDIDSEKRAILINWLVDVSDEYNLQSETLFICTAIIDRFLTKMSIQTSNFQLLGVAAMFIASKYEEIYPPNLYNFVEVTDDSYSGQQIRQMEQEILKTLNFRISLPSITFFLRQIFAYNKFSTRVYHLAEYLCFLSLIADDPFLEYYPSEIALAAVILAAHELDSAASISADLKNAYDKSNLDQLHRRQIPKGTKLMDIDRRMYISNKCLPLCIESLRTLQEQAKLTSSAAIVSKFSTDQHGCVASIKPPKVEDLLSY